MKKLIFLFLAIAGLSSAPKLIAGTLYADQLAFIEEEEAETLYQKVMRTVLTPAHHK